MEATVLAPKQNPNAALGWHRWSIRSEPISFWLDRLTIADYLMAVNQRQDLNRPAVNRFAEPRKVIIQGVGRGGAPPLLEFVESQRALAFETSCEPNKSLEKTMLRRKL
jgi:hypothetical protein